MTPAQKDLAHASIILAYLRNAAWELNATPLHQSLIRQWESMHRTAEKETNSELWMEFQA